MSSAYIQEADGSRVRRTAPERTTFVIQMKQMIRLNERIDRMGFRVGMSKLSDDSSVFTIHMIGNPSEFESHPKRFFIPYSLTPSPTISFPAFAIK